MTQDKSREKSLLFLLSTVARSLEVPLEHKEDLRKSIATLLITERDDIWNITASTSLGGEKSYSIPKTRFIFYPVKDSTTYEMNPAILNKNSAQEVLLSLFAEYSALVPGKKSVVVEKNASKYLPQSFAWVSIFAISGSFLPPLPSALIVFAHLVTSTSGHFLKSIRRWMLIAGVSIPALGFLLSSHSSVGDRNQLFCQIILLFLSDLLIRHESGRTSRILLGFSKIIIVIVLGVTTTLPMEHKIQYLFFILVLASGYLLHRQQINASLRSFFTLVFIALFLSYLVTSLIFNPIRILLIPYVLLLSIYQILFGDNRNPSKIMFGAPCLTI